MPFGFSHTAQDFSAASLRARKRFAALDWRYRRAPASGTALNVNRLTAPGELQFRVARLGDAIAILSLVEGAYRGDESRKGWTTEADLLAGQRTDLAQIAELIAESSGALWLATREAELLACVHFAPTAEPGEQVAQSLRGALRCVKLGMFAVRPTLQGQGIGSALLRHAERIAQSEYQANWLELHVIALRSELIGYYERRNYRITGETEEFPYGNSRFGLPLRDDLVFSVLRKQLA
jgi:GNAT superfamily N-acetyltransferase